MKPSRRIRRSATTSIARFTSTKTGRVVEAESPLERDLFRMCEMNPNVVDYVHQPLTIEYVGDDGKTHRYTPDALIRFRRRPAACGPSGMLVEVKPVRYLWKKWPKMRRKMREAIGWARRHGFTFHIYDESRIRPQFWRNASFLLPYRGQDPTAPAARALLRILARGPQSIDGVLEAMRADGFQQDDSAPALYGLIADHAVVVDLEKPLRRISVVTL